MDFRFLRASSLPLSLVCLLGLDGVAPLASSQGTPPPPGQPATSVRPRMREHFSRGAAIRDAIIRADLEGVREPATWLAEHPQQDLPAAAQSNVRDMQRLAAEVAAAPDLAQAARGVARLAAACGACHTVVEATPTLMAALPRGENETLAGHMRKHYRAADLLYRGLVVPSTHSWNAGADALTGDPVELELKRGSTPEPDVEALARQLHGLAQEARKAEDPKSRSDVYGRMLVTCADCHKRQNVEIRRSSGAPAPLLLP
jgi:mono/diheme cytochrome c family protein